MATFVTCHRCGIRRPPTSLTQIPADPQAAYACKAEDTAHCDRRRAETDWNTYCRDLDACEKRLLPLLLKDAVREGP